MRGYQSSEHGRSKSIPTIEADKRSPGWREIVFMMPMCRPWGRRICGVTSRTGRRPRAHSASGRKRAKRRRAKGFSPCVHDGVQCPGQSSTKPNRSCESDTNRVSAPSGTRRGPWSVAWDETCNQKPDRAATIGEPPTGAGRDYVTRTPTRGHNSKPTTISERECASL